MPGFFKKKVPNKEEVAVQEDVENVRDKADKTSSAICAALPIVDPFKFEDNASKQLVHSVAQQEVIDFLKERYAYDLPEHVVNNEAFIKMLHQPLTCINNYEKLVRTYMKGQVKKTTSELSKTININGINKQIVALENKLKDNSKTEISLSRGLTQVNIPSAIKQAKQTEVSALALSIQNQMKTSNIKYKVSKRISKQEKNAKKFIVTHEISTTVKCCNTGLTWDQDFTFSETNIIHGTYVPI